MAAGDTNLTNVVISGVLTLGSTDVTANATELNSLDRDTAQTMTADGAITIKNGVVLLNKAGVLAATLANPTATTDDYKRLHIIALQAQANTVTVTGGLGNGGATKDVATFSGAVGDNLSLMAYQGYWYVVGQYGITLA